ncbi:MAG TPA: hypothetical protein VJB98_01115 [Candidatus Paceibacterota bacterium]
MTKEPQQPDLFVEVAKQEDQASFARETRARELSLAAIARYRGATASFDRMLASVAPKQGGVCVN